MGDTIAAPLSGDASGTEYIQNGQFLVDIGRNYSKPILKLVGRTFEHYEKRLSEELKLVGGTIEQNEKQLSGTIEQYEKQISEKLCKLNPCTEWESWTRCSEAVVDRFGMRTRSRNCSTGCTNQAARNFPTLESNVCEGQCPKTYNYTNGYCLQVFTTVVAKSDAQAACEKDGGHLVNINNRDKSDTVHAILKSSEIATTTYVWINGKRTQAGGDWHYTYGNVPDFENWYSSEPSNYLK